MKTISKGKFVDAHKMCREWITDNVGKNPGHKDVGREQKEMAEAIDDKRLLGEIIEEFLPVFKRMKHLKNLDDMLESCARMAPLILAKTMMFGDDREQRGAANDVLNRVLGKPVERVMTANLGTLSSVEVDNELGRLLRKYGRVGQEAIAPVVIGEGEDRGGDESG